MRSANPKKGSRHVRSAIRSIIEPRLAELGFSGHYPDFRREVGIEIHYIQIYHRKYGGGFSIAGGWMKRPLGNGTAAAPSLAVTDFNNRAHVERIADLCRIDGTMARQSLGDFDYECIGDDHAACTALVMEAASALNQLDRWLVTRQPGEAISCKGHRLRHGLSPLLLWHLARAQVGSFDLAAKRPETPFLDGQREADIVDYPCGPATQADPENCSS